MPELLARSPWPGGNVIAGSWVRNGQPSRFSVAPDGRVLARLAG